MQSLKRKRKRKKIKRPKQNEKRILERRGRKEKYSDKTGWQARLIDRYNDRFGYYLILHKTIKFNIVRLSLSTSTSTTIIT